jgi:hypothetical protein
LKTPQTALNKKVVTITQACVLKCSSTTHRNIRQYSTQTGIPMTRVVNDMAADWLDSVGKARLEALGRPVILSHFETKGAR